ncbi:hypothetical protein NBRC10512v2_002281 [Rhodotorula toruloides]|uniref:hydroxyisourate hydrolase n=2 Tax=Rhodotorula toruloides TaxID=5286 RepID=A0A061AS37_RHOTO|nr:5-hydroxyisourate hydrolase [Rhodotorula toruloides]CDR38186.1 RHTO0S03e05358g1_1 [Rhodotorula toruloides]
MQNSHLFGAYNVYAQQQQPSHSGAQQQQGLAAAFGQPPQYGQPQQQPGGQQQQDISLGHLQQHAPQQQQQQQQAGAIAGPSGVGLHEHPDADDDDDEGDSGLHATPSGTTKKKAAGGRPRDKVWELFDGDRDVARCQWCSWKTDHPKAFRMRAHVQQCELIPQEKKDELERFQHDKEERLQAKKERAEARAAQMAAAGPSQPKKVKRDNAGEIVVGTGTPKRMPLPHGGRSPITCHVLDSTSGKPAPDMRIRLDRLNTTGFVLQAQGMTDNDGRCNTLLPPGTHLEIGIFKITFFTNEYFTKRGILSFYPFIEIPFEVKSADEHYHIPCLLSPYSYTTYRGS